MTHKKKRRIHTGDEWEGECERHALQKTWRSAFNGSSCGTSFPVKGDVMYRRVGVRMKETEGRGVFIRTTTFLRKKTQFLCFCGPT